jgi:hypothetical protein
MYKALALAFAAYFFSSSSFGAPRAHEPGARPQPLEGSQQVENRLGAGPLAQVVVEARDLGI